MDYSNKYCEMCYQAKELQESSNSIPTRKIFMEKINDNTYTSSKYAEKSNTSFWLPSESQLQQLVFDDKEENYFSFIKGIYTNNDIALNVFSSFEQYRLAYLMKIKFNKIWIGNAWQRETDTKTI